MPLVNENYLKLRGAYLFPEIDRRVRAHVAAHPDAAGRVIKCGIGDVTEPLPAAVIDAMHRAVDDMARPDTFKGYGPPTGYAFLREAIAAHDFAPLGVEVSPDEVFISDGSKTDCSAVLDILAADGANRVAITDPVYPVYVDSNVMVGNGGAALDTGAYDGLVYLPCTPANDFVPDVPNVPVDVVYLCYPNNPTGGMIDRLRLEGWVRWALEHDAIILYDVAYRAYITEADLPRSIYEIDGARRCAMEFHSFSKNGGFTGVRCGFTVVPKELVARTRAGDRVPLHGVWTRRWSTKSNNVAYIVQRAAEATYSDAGAEQVRGLVDGYLRNAAQLRDGCRAAGLEVYGGVNAPYVWVACPDGVSSWDMFDRMLERAGVVVTPGVGFGRCGEGFFRISAFNSPGNIAEVVERLGRLAGDLVAAGA